MTKHPDLFAALAAPFEPSEVKARTQANRQVHYITARTAMNRLDNVLGPENWWDEYLPGESSVLCRLTIRLPDGSTLTKADAGGYAGMSDEGDDDKSGYSDAFKRAAVKFGIARYLYRDGVPQFARDWVDRQANPEPTTPKVHQPEPDPPPANRKQRHDWPGASTPAAPSPAGSPAPTSSGTVPASGKALYRWVREQEERHQVGLLKYLNSWAKLQEFPGRMVDWDADQVALAHAEALRKLAAIDSQEVA